jgi:hypothetical protein
MFSPSLLADDLFLDNGPLPQVLTATRLKQSPAAVPGSMTVIDREWINASGARIAKRIGLGKVNLELAGILQQRLDNQPTPFVDNNDDERRVVYVSAELTF